MCVRVCSCSSTSCACLSNCWDTLAALTRSEAPREESERKRCVRELIRAPFLARRQSAARTDRSSLDTFGGELKPGRLSVVCLLPEKKNMVKKGTPRPSEALWVPVSTNRWGQKIRRVRGRRGHSIRRMEEQQTRKVWRLGQNGQGRTKTGKAGRLAGRRACMPVQSILQLLRTDAPT